MIQQGCCRSWTHCGHAECLGSWSHTSRRCRLIQWRFSVPYLWGTVGIGYDSAVISAVPDSWSILWDARYKGLSVC